MRIHPLRLRPGQDLRESLERFTRIRGVRAAVVLSAVGSLRNPHVRFADDAQPTVLAGSFEILSLAGTLSREGAHLHIAMADSSGTVLGGHLARGCAVHTTAEIVIAELRGIQFARRFDVQTGYRELVIRGRARGLRPDRRGRACET
jgi:uncharacterized protein